MSLLSSLYAGASGLDTNSLELTVIGDNIANGNTIGFKGSRAVFSDALSQSLMGGAGETGLGTTLSAVQKIITQGSLLNTGVNTDLAIQGAGFFVVRGNHNGTVGQFYTRAGQFTVDKDGYMVNVEGLRVQGYTADAAGVVGSQLGDIRPGVASSAPYATTGIKLTANLQADAEVLTDPFDVTNAAATSNFSTTTTVYDSLGVAHQIDVYFRKTGTNTWDWHAVTSVGGVPTEIGGTTLGATDLTFDEFGQLTSSGPFELTDFQPFGAAGGNQTVTLDFGSTDRPGLTQFAAKSAASFVSQDGYPSGDLASIQIDGQGQIVGVFTNGQTRALGAVALGDFPAEDQLQRVGSSLYAETPKAGAAVIGPSGNGGRGTITAGALEQSNIDLSAEFIKMIAAQRSFQANSKTINTADQLLSEIIALKRG
jgi:flagellar hook protein FlgE